VSGKGKNKKGAQLSRAQQQQQAAARRGLAHSGGSQSGSKTIRTAGDGLAPPTASGDAAGQPAVRPAPQAASSPGPTSPVPVKVGHYVDVSVIRIQDWLGRTPDLKFRRGASVLLSEATERESWDARLPDGAAWNSAAGEVDGVVPLVLDDGTDGDPDDRAADVARQVVERMRAVMPHCQIQAVAGRGASYATAYPTMAAARRDGDLLIDCPAAPPELFLAKPCDQCRSAAATRSHVTVTSGEQPVDVCDECAARLDAAGRTAGRPAQSPRPERCLWQALKVAGMEVADFSDTFADVAAAGERDRDDKATQVALIYADGNRVGAFLTKAADTPGGPDKAELAPLLDQAARGALARAVIDRFNGWARPPVLVNLAGGDDILVSVPAPDAWLFTKTLLDSFTAILAERASSWPRAARDSIPTMAAGLVFHHVKTPFSDVVRLADGQLHDAKAKTRGSAAIAFLDMTADGNAPPEGRLPVRVADLGKQAAWLTQVAALPGSRRQALLDLYRSGETDGFIARLTDFADNRPLWQIAAGPGATAPAVRDELRRSKARRDEVRRALDIARHWHAEPRTEEKQETRESREVERR
jgi:hypothetical protein